MTDKQKIAGLCFGIALIVAGGFAWDYSLTNKDCDLLSHNIHRLLDNQDSLLYTYGFFAENILTEDRQLALKQVIEAKEPFPKALIEHFQKNCRSRLRKSELITMLKGFDLYLRAKQGIFKESQRTGSHWIRATFPYQPTYESFE